MKYFHYEEVPHFLRLVLAIALLPPAAHGTVVTTLADEDNGSLVGGSGISLREAVTYSAAGETVTFAPALAGQTIRLTGGQITITKSLTIDASALSERITLSGDKTGNGKTSDDTRVFQIDDKAVVLDSLIISGATNSSDSYGGGAINAIGHSVKLTVNRCTFSQNHGSPEGGAIYFYGAYQAPETALIVRSSTFSGNTATQSGGAISAFGVLDILSSTISGNSASRGGRIYIYLYSPSRIDSTTVAGNSAPSGGSGIYNNSEVLILNNTIVAGNATTNLVGTFTGEYNLTSGDPYLAPLGDYGGLTQTMPPLPQSPAIKAAGGTVPSTDQRGFPRVEVPDIGAVEYQGSADATRFWHLDFDGDGSSFGIEQALGTNPFLSDSSSPRSFSGPTINGSGQPVLKFGLSYTTASGTRWVLSRSPDLSPGSFKEIYRTNGYTDIAAAGITFVRTVTDVTVTDTTAPTGSVFYRFEARLEP